MAGANPLVRIRSGTPIRIESVTGANTLEMADVKMERMSYPAKRYDGSYDFTPSDEEQVIAISGQIAEQNIVIHPIPQNYGRVAWDGNTLTVS